MCGRYVLHMRPSEVRRRLAEQDMPVDDAPDDDDQQLRQSYNFAPGYHGLIYRARTYERAGTQATKYQLQAAQWGLIPFWTKRPPHGGSQMKTINCRDDSLVENRGVWNTMKQRKRCIVVAEGFYEWLKTNNGKEKIPHLVKRKDGQLMALAGLWDMVQYEGSGEKLYTYTIITTHSNKQLSFLHDRMPVILEADSDAMRMWLDPNNVGWSKELQSILKPCDGELECYPVDKAVGRVGNNSPTFVIPIDSKENKKNIANFFGTRRPTADEVAAKNEAVHMDHVKRGRHQDENRDTTIKTESNRDNAPLPRPKGEIGHDLSQRIHETEEEHDARAISKANEQQSEKGIKRERSEVDDQSLIDVAESPPNKAIKTEHSSASPAQSPTVKSNAGKKTRSATTNNTVAKAPSKGGNAKITSFFGR